MDANEMPYSSVNPQPKSSSLPQSSQEKAKSTLESTKGELKNKMQEVKESAQDLKENLSTTIQDKAKTVRRSASEYYQRGKDRAQDMEQSFEEQIHRRPLLSILTAATIGMLLGKVINRKRTMGID